MRDERPNDADDVEVAGVFAELLARLERLGARESLDELYGETLVRAFRPPAAPPPARRWRLLDEPARPVLRLVAVTRPAAAGARPLCLRPASYPAAPDPALRAGRCAARVSFALSVFLVVHLLTYWVLAHVL